MKDKKIVIEMEVDPYRGMAIVAASMCPVGYELLEMSRKGTQAKLIYVLKED